MTTPLSAFAGTAIYLDTMLPYVLLRGVEPDVKPFFGRLERGELVAYTCTLTFDELAYRLILAFVKDRYGGSPLERLREEEDKIMAEFASPAANLLRRLRAFTHLVVLDVLESDLDVMEAAMVQYHLRPRDALHLAAMQRSCLDLASNDGHFDRVPHLNRFTF